ncbi:MAG TPA: methyltransferase domain-containing protein [Rhizomicrobium sp.]|jgi:SAM-dependent methyltransferase
MVHWARAVMDARTDGLVSRLDVENMDALEISGDHWARNFRWKSFETVHYPEIDICAAPAFDRLFDIIFAEQVFEHLLYPYRAARNVHRMLRPGGYFLLTTPFLIKVHDTPNDCCRWTAQGLSYFLEECGFPRSRMTVDSWGNRACIQANFTSWVEFDPHLHALENEPDFPIVVWALARK